MSRAKCFICFLSLSAERFSSFPTTTSARAHVRVPTRNKRRATNALDIVRSIYIKKKKNPIINTNRERTIAVRRRVVRFGLVHSVRPPTNAGRRRCLSVVRSTTGTRVSVVMCCYWCCFRPKYGRTVPARRDSRSSRRDSRRWSIFTIFMKDVRRAIFAPNTFYIYRACTRDEW